MDDQTAAKDTGASQRQTADAAQPGAPESLSPEPVASLADAPAQPVTADSVASDAEEPAADAPLARDDPPADAPLARDGPPADAPLDRDQPAAGAEPKARKAPWVLLALLCLLAGAACSLLVARSLASREQSATASAFRLTTAGIASRLNDATQREQDLTVAAGSLLAGDPKVSPAEFAAWASWSQVLARYPELRRLTLVTAHGGSVTVARARAGRGRVAELQRPVYRGLPRPLSQTGQTKAFLGSVRAFVRPRVLLRRALVGHPGYSALLGDGQSPDAVAHVGQMPGSNAQIEVTRLANGWRLESIAPAASAPLLASGRMWVLVAGLLIGALLGALALALGIPRRQAPVVVEVPAPAPEELPAQTLYDSLTGLPNSALALDRAAGMLARADRQSGMLTGALLIDIDWFKDINDKLGPGAGDQVLKIVAGRLEETMRAQDTVGRLEGDQFVVLVECTARSVRLDSLAQRVIEALHKPIELEGFGPSFFMTASVGVTFGRYETPAELLRDAQLALDAAKAGGRDRYALFNASTSSVVEGRSTLEAELNAAVQEDQFHLVFEPIVELGSRHVRGMQAQPRWQHPQRGVLPAEEFVPLAEDNGLIVPIDRWVLEEACNRAASWEVEGQRIGVSVRVAVDQLGREGLAIDIRRALQQSGLDPSLLTVEIAETAVMRDVSAAARHLGEIKQLGVRLAIADFGASGYAYHSDLRKLRLDCLRVDRRSLAAADDAEYRDWLMEAILMVGRELSLQVIAEGVESEEQAEALQAMGCTTGQGPHLGGAVPATGVIALCQPGALLPQAAGVAAATTSVAGAVAPTTQPA